MESIRVVTYSNAFGFDILCRCIQKSRYVLLLLQAYWKRKKKQFGIAHAVARHYRTARNASFQWKWKKNGFFSLVHFAFPFLLISQKLNRVSGLMNIKTNTICDQCKKYEHIYDANGIHINTSQLPIFELSREI